MKKILLLLSSLTLSLFFAVSCYDDSELRERMDNAEQRLAALEELCNSLNSNILSLQSIIDAMEGGIIVLNVEETENGYIIYFSDGSKIQIDTSFEQPVPQIGVQEYEGKYYWTIDGGWLTDSEGNKILAEAAVPELKIEDDTWYVSYDNGQTWTPLGNSTGDSFFEEVKEDDDYVYFVLKDGTTITVAKSKDQPALYLQLNTESIIEMSAGETKDIEYEIISADDASVTFETFEQYGWSVVISPNPENSDSGTVSITAPSPIRDGKILFMLSDDKGNFYAKTVEIKGKGNIIEVVKDSYIIDEKGGLLDVPVNSNIEFTVRIPDDAASWIETVFAGETTRFSIKANDSYDERTAVVTFMGNDGETKKEISITQLQKNAILLTSSVFDISAEEQTVTLVFTANVNVSVKIPDDVSWISYAPTKAMTERTIELSVMANDSPEERTAAVILTDDNNSVSDTVTINQSGYQADYITFEDKLFKEVLVEQYDSNDDGEIDSREALSVTDIVCSGKSIYSLKGVERFANLKTLDCSNNSIVELDLTANSELTSLKCNSNSLVELNISGLEKLTYLDCKSNSLTDVSTDTNKELTYYDCSSNNFKALDVSGNAKLEKLYCHSCQLLQTLNIENASSLTALYLNSSSDNSVMQRTVNIDGSSLQSLIMGGDAKWTDVVISNNLNLTTLDLSGLVTMTSLTCTSNPQLSEMTVNNCYALKELECTANILAALDLSTNKAISSLDCSGNRLQTLDLSNNVALLSLDCNNNNLSSLSVNNSLSIDHIDCSANALSVIDVTSLSELSYIDCSGNDIKSLDLSNNVKLVTLDCSGNPLNGLDLSKNVTIERVNSSTTNITALDLTANTSLSEMLCKDCYNLSGVIFPETLVAIQQEAFMNCTSLTSLTFPASITSLGQDAFRNCTKLSELNINSDIIGEKFYESYFTGDPVSTVNMNENVTAIGESAFVGTQIASIMIPASVTEIKTSAFRRIKTLSYVSFAINSKLQAIRGQAFYECENLESFDASKCNNIKTMLEGNYLRGVFYGCAITDFKIGTVTPPDIDAYFYDLTITNLYVPKGCVDAYKASDWGVFCTNIFELE